MKLMIASDLHGSGYYCKKLVDAYRQEAPDKLILLGDLLYHGPRNDLPREYAPKDVIGQLNALGGDLLAVRGNCEAEVDQMVLSFPIMADYAWLSVDGLELFATHGHLFGEDNPPPVKKGTLLLCGHTHVPAYREHDGYIYVNPGSLAIPKENSKHSYLILKDRILTWKSVEDQTEYMQHKI